VLHKDLDQSVESSESTMSREEFLKTVFKRAAVAGALVAAPAIADKFLVPAAFAQTSTCTVPGTTGNATDTGAGGSFTNGFDTTSVTRTAGSTDAVPNNKSGSIHVETSCTSSSADTKPSGPGDFLFGYVFCKAQLC
jgi:hypothetical protein